MMCVTFVGTTDPTFATASLLAASSLLAAPSRFRFSRRRTGGTGSTTHHALAALRTLSTTATALIATFSSSTRGGYGSTRGYYDHHIRAASNL